MPDDNNNDKEEATKKRDNTSADDEQPAAKKAKRRGKKKQIDPAVQTLRRTIQQSCRHNDLNRALEAYDEAVRKDITVEAYLYYHLLALCGGLQEEGSSLHVGVPKKEPPKRAELPPTEEGDAKSNLETNDQVKEKGKDDEKVVTTPSNNDNGAAEEPKEVAAQKMPLEDRLRHAFRIKAAMDAAQIPLTEAAYTAMIKLLTKSGDLEQANSLLLESETVQQCNPKLRLYSSLLHAYAAAQKPLDAVRIWYRLTRQKLLMTEREYLALLRCAIACQSPTLMESVLTDLAEDVPVPSRDTTQTIVDWFSAPITASLEKMTETDESQVKALLAKVHTPLDDSMRMVSACMGPVQALTGWTISHDCTIDASNGTLTSGCLEGETLNPIEIAAETWQDMQRANETIVLSGQLQQHKSQYQGGGKGSKRIPHDKKEREHHWQQFCRYLAARKTPVDVVIDGANVGYFEQNFDGAPKHVSYEQIDWVIQAFRSRGKSVLVVMHSRHFIRQKMPRQYVPLMERWIRQDLLYRTPPGMNDDWFWMHAALVRPGTLVVTNDEMRDHHFQMLAPRSFLRWKDRHQVHFAIGGWETHQQQRQQQQGERGRSGRRKVVSLKFPDPYTRRIQRVADGLVVPLPKRGDENRFLDGRFVEDDDKVPAFETYLCIRPKTS